MFRSYLAVGLLISLMPLVRHTISSPYFVLVFYNENKSALVSQPIKARKPLLAQQQATQYLLDQKLDHYHYFIIGPYDSEAEANDAQQKKLEQFQEFDFQAQSVPFPISALTTSVPLNPSRLDFGKVFYTNQRSLESNPTKGVFGYVRAAQSRLAIQVYSETINGQKGPLLYEGWLDKGDLVKLQSEWGRIVFRYKESETGLWSGAIHVICRGDIQQATPLP